mgnify:FL=1
MSQYGVKFATRLKLDFVQDKNGKPKRLAVRLTELQRQTFNIAGGAIRKTAKRSLRRAKQKPASEMTAIEARSYAAWKRDFEAGRTTQRPRRPEVTSKPGDAPVLDMKPSPLRELIYYALDNNAESVVAGPLVFKPSKKLAKRFTGPTSVEQLEQSHPFMSPALAAVVPRIPSYLKRYIR